MLAVIDNLENKLQHINLHYSLSIRTWYENVFLRRLLLVLRTEEEDMIYIDYTRMIERKRLCANNDII